MKATSTLQVQLWAQQMILAYLDGQPESAQALASKIASATDVDNRLQIAVDELMEMQHAWVKIAVRFHLKELWTNEEMIAGHRAVVEELVPAELRPAVQSRLHIHEAYLARSDAAIAAGKVPLTHPWHNAQVGEPELYAAATLSVWLSRQPQVNANSPAMVREGVLTEIKAAEARLAGTEPLTVTDQDARDLLIRIFDGEDILEVPTDPNARGRQHADAVSIATQWLLEHDGATPTAAQAAELNVRVMGKALGLPVDTDEDNLGMSAVPEDARRLSVDDIAVIEVLALRLLYAFISTNTPAVRDIATSIDQYGEMAYRFATSVIHDIGVIWHNSVWDTLTVRTSNLVPGLERVINLVVPEGKKEATWHAYMPILIRITDHGLGDFRPRPTRDVESDLFLTAAYATWFAEQPQINPQRVRERLAGLIEYLAQEDRTRTARTLTEAQLDQARRVLRDLVGPRAASRVPEPHQCTREQDQLLAAAFDAQSDLNAAYQVHRMNDFAEALVDAAEDEKRAQRRRANPEEQATRRQAERQLRTKRKKKKR